jgi:hypothetical protein
MSIHLKDFASKTSFFSSALEAAAPPPPEGFEAAAAPTCPTVCAPWVHHNPRKVPSFNLAQLTRMRSSTRPLAAWGGWKSSGSDEGLKKREGGGGYSGARGTSEATF